MPRTNLSIRLDDETRMRLDRISARTGMKRAFLIEEALRVYLDHETWLTDQIELGVESTARSRADHAVLMAAVSSALRERSS